MSNKIKQTQHKPRFDYKQAQMNAEKKKKRRNQIYAYILLFFFVLWTVGTALSFFNFFGGKNSMSASAESVSAAEVSTVSEEVESGFDLSQYPTANLIPYPYVSSGYTAEVGFSVTLNGVTWTVNNDGSISACGVSTDVSYFDVLNGNLFTFEPNIVYAFDCSLNSFSSGNNSIFVRVDYTTFDGLNKSVYDSSGFFIFDASTICTLSLLRFYVKAGVTLDNFIFYPMLNVGEVAYPYSPSFDLIYNKGYQSGYGDGELNGYYLGYEFGYNSGYNSGYWEGFDDGELSAGNAAYYGVFQYLNAEVRMYAADGTFVGACSDWLKGPNSVTFGPIYEYFLTTYKSGYYFELMIAAGHGYENEVPLSLMNGCIVGKGDLSNYSLSNSFSVYGTNYFTQQYYAFSGYFEQMDAGFDPLPAYTLFFNQGSEDPDLSQIGFGYMTLRFDDIDIFKKLQFIYTDGFYNQGYNKGYNAGYSNGMIDGHQPGYDQGYIVGKEDGEKVGFNNGIAFGKEQGLIEGEAIGYNKGAKAAGNYTFLSLISAVVDVPIQAFSSLFSFDILGINIKNFLLGLFTLAVVLCVVKLILAK